MTNLRESHYYTVAQAARILDVSPATVWRWIDAKKLRAYRVGPHGIRIKPEDLEAMIQPARSEEPKAVREPGPQGIWAGYDPGRVREALNHSAGALAGVDRDELLADIREERQQKDNTGAD